MKIILMIVILLGGVWTIKQGVYLFEKDSLYKLIVKQWESFD